MIDQERGDMDNTQYDLKVIICHIGTAQQGHYVSIVRHNQTWYHLNNHIIRQVPQSYEKPYPD